MLLGNLRLYTLKMVQLVCMARNSAFFYNAIIDATDYFTRLIPFDIFVRIFDPADGMQ